MRKDHYTIIVVPQHSSKVKRYKLSKKIIKASIASAIAFLLVSSWFAYDYVLTKNQIWEVAYLREDNQSQKKQIQAFQDKIVSFERQMGNLMQFDAKLRIITNLDPSIEKGQYIGVGGQDGGLVVNYEERKDFQIKKMHSDLENLQVEAAVQEASFVELKEFLEDKKSLLASTPSIWPVRGWLTSGFGRRISPFTGRRKMHDGLDIASRIGTPIVAPADGRVTYVGVERGYGKILVVDHGYGVITRYGHNSKIFVKVREKIKRGQKIAAVGNTGRSTGPHLHYEVRVNGVPVNPKNYILN